jgi:hypothetical protein
MDVEFTASFSLSEWTRQGPTALRLGIQVEATPEDVENIGGLARGPLQYLRNGCGRTDVLDGLRDKKLNKAMGGSSTSQHVTTAERAKGVSLTAAAADVRTVNTSSKVAWALLRKGIKAGETTVDQAIWYPEEERFHISFDRSEDADANRNELLVAFKNPAYKPGGKAAKHTYQSWAKWAQARGIAP